ncbi:MAG TPA: hypothetical protein VFZ65_20745 [Planctomycetota bacterium]|nr:hypothetical protein [Planctomycetota bacterium]
MRPNPRTGIVLLAATLFVAHRAPAQSEQPDPPADPLLVEAAKLLAAVGYTVPEHMRSESRSDRLVLADLDAQQDLLLPEFAFDLQHALFAGLGLPAGSDAAALRKQAVAAMARGLGAYYDPLRKTFVLLHNASRETNEALAGGLLPLVTHELVHAHQDAREGGLARFFGAAGRTLDSAEACRCVIEGEAEIAAVAALRGETAIEQLGDMKMANDLDSLYAGELTGLIYGAGRRLAAARYRAGGLAAVRELWTRPPLSTEQALHPAKYGRDTATAVRVPDVEGLTAARATTVGELLTFSLLRQLRVGRLDASVAATGWDGDRLVAFDRGERTDVALVWRSVWDRDEDAADFAARLGACGDGEVVRDRRVVDWISTDDEALRPRVAAACAADRPQPEAVAEDASSTAEAEAALRQEMGQDTVDGGFWRHSALGLDVPVPEGWQLREVGGVKLLLDPQSVQQGVALNVNVTTAPRGDLADLDAAIAANRQQMTQMKLSIDSLARTERGGVEVLAGEYHGRIGKMQPLHFLFLVYFREDEQVIVTGTSTERHWPENEAPLRALMAGVRVKAP